MTLRLGPDITYFLWSIVAGIVLSFVYDILRASRKVVSDNTVIVNIEDIIYILLSGMASVLGAYYINNGIFRIYSLITIYAVIFIYRLTIKNFFVNIYVFVCKKIKGFIMLCIGVILKVIKAVKNITAFLNRKFRPQK